MKVRVSSRTSPRPLPEPCQPVRRRLGLLSRKHFAGSGPLGLGGGDASSSGRSSGGGVVKWCLLQPRTRQAPAPLPNLPPTAPTPRQQSIATHKVTVSLPSPRQGGHNYRSQHYVALGHGTATHQNTKPITSIRVHRHRTTSR